MIKPIQEIKVGWTSRKSQGWHDNEARPLQLKDNVCQMGPFNFLVVGQMLTLTYPCSLENSGKADCTKQMGRRAMG